MCLLHLSSENIFHVLTRALLGGGGGGVWTPPSGFSRLAKIPTAARSAAGFSPHLTPHLFRNFCEKFRPNAMCGQVTRSGQVTQLQNNFPIAPRLQCFRESYETFRIWWGHQCLQNVYLGFFYIGDLRSGQFLRPPHHKSMGKKSTPLYLLWPKHIWVESYIIGQLWTIRVKICIAYPSKGHLRSPEVTNRHLPKLLIKKR